MKLFVRSRAVMVALCSTGVIAELFCDSAILGLPRLEDCSILVDQLADPEDHTLRVFAEEQLSLDGTGSWPGLWGGAYGEAEIEDAVQLPRIYSSSEGIAVN